METLLPSEIARLVLGYLEDQKCSEAAKMFLETSPHLQECRTVLSHGRRFGTRVSGLTLMDVIEKFSAINTMIQERLNKATDCEQLKHCGDLMEQLKFLVEEPRGQRFVVNINVPSQSNSQVSNGSPIITSSLRKRRHSNSERIKRTNKSQSNTSLMDAVTSTPTSCLNIDTTPLESLPGNMDLLKQAEFNINIVENKDNNVIQESSSQYDVNKNSIHNTAYERHNNTRRTSEDIPNVENCKMDIDDVQKEEESKSSGMFKRCTTATSTEELLSFSSTEVQTIPYDVPESEPETNDEPIENLSILTKEILNRTELQECIAENINKAILPTDLSLREESLNELVTGEGNTSIMAELNNAIKSIVEATESDPVFEKFLDEIIGPSVETDTSPDEDGEGKPLNDVFSVQEKPAESILNNINSPEPILTDIRISTGNDVADIPLKQRLRSSSRQQNNRIEDEVDKTKEQEKEQNALEDQNAAAVLSIINANITNVNIANVPIDKKMLNDTKALNDDNGQKLETIIPVLNKDDAALKPITSDIQKMNVTSSTNAESKTKKTTVKRPRPTKPKRDQVISDNECITKQEIMTMPTLILCSKEEINNLLTINSSTIKSTSKSHFIPIAPKEPNRIKESVETIYLRTINVAHNVPVPRLPTVIDESNNPVNQQLIQSQGKNNKVNKKLKTVHKSDVVVPLNTNQQVLNPVESVQTSKTVGSESITLYGNESNAKTFLDGTDVQMINLEENISLSASGLSPYLKFNCNKTNQNHNLSDIDLAPIIESIKATEVNNETNEQFSTICKSTERDIITKRTPRSLLKSRSKNHRLSLSTPRRRSTHVRALDFSTPTKINSSKKVNENGNTPLSSASTKHLKPLCRTSLFKSPSLSNSSVTTQKQKSPTKLCHSYKIPIATRSPIPKLMGGWDKYNGVGVIIGDTFSHGSTNASCSSEDKIQHKPSKPLTKSWDADLRRSIQLNNKNEIEKTVKKKVPTKYKSSIVHKKDKDNPRSTKNKKNTCEVNLSNQEMQDNNKLQENVQENTKILTIENNNEKKQITKNVDNFVTNKRDEISKSTDIREISVKPKSDVVTEKKPIKKYVQLKTIKTNLKKPDGGEKKGIEGSQMNAQIVELMKMPSDTMQHILQIPDMTDLGTPRKFNNLSGPPPTPRVLSPSSNIITPFVNLSEDSTRIRSFISTPEFPITPSIALTPKFMEETTRDNIKKGDYNSPYYKPSSEQDGNSDKISKSESNVNMQKSPVISSSHIKLQSMHNSFTSGNNYQACSSSKLEITQFEVIKENLPKEEAIKELKIATSSKDCTTESNTTDPIVDRHVDMIQINEYKGISKHCETINDGNYVEFHNENDSTRSDSSSSSDTSSSSSSSSASTNSHTNSSATCSPNKKIDEASNNMYPDINNDSAQKDVNVHDDTKVMKETSVNVETCQKLDNPSFGMESSPKKLFKIEKTDDEIQETLKETPAKDENLLNETGISETPSGSRSGMEILTNLSSKISAIITEDEKLSRINKLSNDCEQTLDQLKTKPKIIDIQYIRLESSKCLEPVKSIQHKCQSGTEENPPIPNMIAQLEEKRQRMIAKFKDAPKSNLSNITKRKHILVNKASDNQFSRGQQKYVRAVTKYPRKTRINKDTSTKHQDNLKMNSVINTRKRCGLQKQNSINKHCDNENDIKKQISPPRNIDPESNSKPLNDHTTKQSQKDDINKEEIIISENKELEDITHLRENLSLEEQENLDIKSDATVRKQENYGIKSNIETEEIGKIIKNNNACMKISNNDVNTTEKEIATEKNVALDKVQQKICEQTENKVHRLQSYTNQISTSKGILKCKVDQVKRDLFSDEENEQKMSRISSAKNDRIQKIARVEIQNSDLTQISITRDDTNAENPKEELSTVLQCLQLVPTHKNDYMYENQNQNEKRYQEQNENKIGTDDKSNQSTDIHNYKVEYHFVYDDSVPVRKRRRRYSGHELQIEINHADLSDPDALECIKVLKATEFEEIFNLPPKTRKRALNKKTPTKNEKDCETYNSKIDSSVTVLKNNVTKLLGASCPTDKSTGSKVKKMTIKTAAINKTDHDMQSDAKKKQKPDKLHENVSDITAKNRKRKLSETKETKQSEKKPCTADPQTLLNNLDLDEFLTTVHGPE